MVGEALHWIEDVTRTILLLGGLTVSNLRQSSHIIEGEIRVRYGQNLGRLGSIKDSFVIYAYKV